MFRVALAVLGLWAVSGCQLGDDESRNWVMVGFSTPPASKPAIGATVEVVWEVRKDTTDQLRRTELRVCEGADVDGCGLGSESSYVSIRWDSDFGDRYWADVQFTAPGVQTIVAWALVGDGEHTSRTYTVDPQ